MGRRKRNQNKLGMVLISGVILAMMAVILVNGYSLYQTREDYSGRLKELETRILEEETRSKEIAAYGKYTHTRQYIEETAREKLGLVYGDEIMFKAEE